MSLELPPMLLGRLIVFEAGLYNLIDNDMPVMATSNHLIDGAPVGQSAKVAVVNEDVGLDLPRKGRIIVSSLFRIVTIDSIELEVAFAAPIDGIVQELAFATSP